MTDYPKFEYHPRQVRSAGDALRVNLLWSPETEQQITETFRIAHSWINSHAYPMNSIRREVAAKIPLAGLEGITVARLKSMPSIRKKLRLGTNNLNQMQDLGGCRAIVPTIADVHTLVERVKSNAKHIFHNEKDYIQEPKQGGYRCHHMIYKFKGKGESEIFNDRRIEIQIRTRLQHSWATAVEALGYFRQEDLKGGSGNVDWLRLFDLMSAELALTEKCPIPSRYPELEQRRKEIRDLDKKLGALNMLEAIRAAVRATDPIYSIPDRPSHYRIEYHRGETESVVKVRAHDKPIGGIESNNAAEVAESREARQIITLYIEADKAEDLKDAYPNYFGDVQVFINNLRNVTQNKDAVEYAMPPLRTAPKPIKEPIGDSTWLKPRAAKGRWSDRSPPPSTKPKVKRKPV